MGLFGGRFAEVVEWEEYQEDIIFWKWSNNEIKKNSRLVIRPGQNAVFMIDGKIEGIFEDEGNFEVESQIVPLLSSFQGMKRKYKNGIRAEVLFVNTRELTVKWGTRMPVNVKTEQFPSGIPIRANGTFSFKVTDYVAIIDKIAGVKNEYRTDDLRERVVSVLNQILMQNISKSGKDIFDLQNDAAEIAKGVREDLDMQMLKDGISITGFVIGSFSYPEEFRKLQADAARNSMGL